jgi:hypothetical protein
MIEPDARKVLKELSYRVQQVCGLCRYGWFTRNHAVGTCDLHTFPSKDEGRKRLPIHEFGSCRQFERGHKSLGHFESR